MMASQAALQSSASPRPVMALHRPHLASPPRALSFLRLQNSNLNRRHRRRLALFPLGLGFGRDRAGIIVVASAYAPAPVDSDGREALERCFSLSPVESMERCLSLSPDAGTPSCSSSSVSSGSSTVMKGGKKYGAIGAVTLEKSKLDLSQKTRKSNPQLEIGGGGGDIGKKNFHGGGDGGDDDGDDDDYFDDFDEEDDGEEGGLFRRRIVIQELFDKKFVDAVLQEWFKSMTNLPAGLRQAYELGLVSSAQMVRFLAINARPTVSRAISRTVPEWLSRAFIGRMIADPAFLLKLLLEETMTCACSVWWEFKNRKERIKQEWQLALVNVLTAMTCNGIIVWSLAPCRSYGNTFRFDLENTIQKLPNNIFENSYPMREFDLQKRIYSFFYKAAEFSLLGLAAGTIQGAISKAFAAKKEGRLSVTIPSVSSNALGYGAFLGLYANMRYQLLNGIDRTMLNHFDVLGVAIFFSTALRILNAQLGETSRHAWLGLEPDPLVESEDLLKAYSRHSDSVESSPSKWFISKNAVISGLGLLGIKQSGEPESTPTKPRRKRIVRKKVNASSA
ncbi:protein RETICULATA-RELATED 1, chloroplastic-like [Zingiber officinale]|uniref:protein RETICULATA-RELATED 1, chloroplastic-like n=1 Tax=Zingiber officinale TaxID=94328 RepID=UPI001C4CA5E6|nr:protein RETICULATA-RELATED 1, chloroplastic-like [Zingiber officinale]